MSTAPRGTSSGDWSLDIASAVRAEAAGRNYRQADLARILHTDRGTINLKWRGLRDWTFGDLEILAGLFGMAPWELVKVDARVRARRDSNPQPAGWESEHDECWQPAGIVLSLPAAAMARAAGEPRRAFRLEVAS